MEPQTVQTDSGKGGGPQKRMKKEWTVKMEGKKSTVKVKEETPSIKLGLGIGAGTAQNHVMTQQGKRVVFTAAQLHELQQQTVIFKFIAARLPVPLHLVVPVWKSVASSFGSANGGIYKQYPSFVGFSPEGFGYRNMMDPEPGRCRRTDGKKWRCRKNVVPDQKYCEGHMHRGRQRSRKLVEASQIAPSSATAPKNSNKYSENSKTISTPATFQLMTPSSSTIISHRTSTTSSDNDRNGIKNSVTTFTISATAANTISTTPNLTPTPTPTISTTSTTPTVIAANTITSTLTTPTITTTPTARNIRTSPTTTNNNNNSDSKTNHNLDGKAVNQSIKNRINMNIRVNISQGVDFSPKSVLQVQGCSGSCFHRSEIELEPGRCRRTDGKKWRCSRDVVPEQKYCTQHMHRGAKKHVDASQPAAVPSATRRPHTKAVSNQANYATPNTKLSISIPASPQLMTNDEKSPNSSDSDTTISDTAITAYEIGYFSS